jgi:hypothetical protein
VSSIDLGSVSRGVQPARRAGWRWTAGLAFAVLLLLQVGACQALLTPSAGAAASTPPAVTACQHETPGHDALCGPGASVAVVGQRLAPRDYPMNTVDVALVVLITALLGTAAAARAWGVHGPPWAQRRAPWGRHLLQSVGITRI